MEKLRDYLTLEGWKRDLREIKKNSCKILQSAVLMISGEACTLMNSVLEHPYYHLSGLIGCALAHVIDGTSTEPLIELANTPEFREYGLEKRFYETNIIIGKHPTMEQFRKRSLIVGLSGLAMCGAVPEAGFLYLIGSPLIVRNNKEARRKLEEELEYERTWYERTSEKAKEAPNQSMLEFESVIRGRK